MKDTIKINSLKKHSFYLKGLNCPVCAKKIEDKINTEKYINSTNFNFSNQKLEVESSVENKELLKERIQNICDNIEDGVMVEYEHKEEKSQEITAYKGVNIKKDVLIFALEILSLIAIHFFSDGYLKISLYGFLYLFVAKDVLINVFSPTKTHSFLDENFLMVIASIAAFITGAYSEAVSVMLFYSVGEFLQDLAVERSRDNITKALALKPSYANLKTKDGIKKVSPEDVKVGDIIIIRPGEKIPLDGIITKGTSEIDTSNISGESLPESVEIGQEILSGVVNLDGLLEIKVTKEYKEGTIGKILDMVENASSKKAGVEKFISRFAGFYTPIVVSFAIILAIFLPVFTGLKIKESIYRACIFLVISCPCALVISVPLGIFAGIGAMSRKAIFVKGGNYLQGLTDVKTIVFDKTGTITEGKFEIFKVIEIAAKEEEILQIAAIGEQFSTHPIAKAIAKEMNNLPKPTNLNNIDGKGITFDLEDNKILVGNKKLLEKYNIQAEQTYKLPLAVHVYVVRDKDLLGIICLRDKLKDNIRKDISLLKSLGITPVLLSGDREEVVKEVCENVGIEKYYGSLLPLDKVSKIEKIMEDTKGKVAFVGDGTNDAPVLTRADIGISMGSGSDIAIESSDVVLLKDEISKVVEAIKISLKTKKIVYQNIALALILKIVILCLGAFGMATMFLAIFADVGVSLICILNSLRVMKA